MRRRQFLTLVGGAAAACPLAARGQQPMPVIGFVSGSSLEMAADRPAAFRRGLSQSGFVEGQNVAVEYHWSIYDEAPSLMADLVRRQVAMIATPGSDVASQAAKAATTTIPIVFGVAQDPVKLGLVESFNRPGGNATGIHFFLGELAAKRLGLLHQLLPKAVRIAVLVNPAGGGTGQRAAETIVRDISDAAPALGLQVRVLKASTSSEIEAAFATLAHEPADAVFIGNNAFFSSRRVQFAILAARQGIPTAAADRESVEAGALMGYGTDIADMYRLVGVSAGQILKGAKPAELPVVQSTKFEFSINLITAKALGLTVPPSLLASADEVIE